jgi:hypothetical protein
MQLLSTWKTGRRISLTGISAEEFHEAYQEIIVAVTKQECIENQNLMIIGQQQQHLKVAV